MGDSLTELIAIHVSEMVNQLLTILYTHRHVSNIVKKCVIQRISALITRFNLQHLVSERSKITDLSILIMRAAISPFAATNDIR